jgi:hypothetical protein
MSRFVSPKWKVGLSYAPGTYNEDHCKAGCICWFAVVRRGKCKAMVLNLKGYFPSWEVNGSGA